MPASPPNPVKGEVEYEYDGQTWRFVFDWPALVEWERATDSSFAGFMSAAALSSVGGPPVKLHHLGEFMRCGLLRHHPGTDAETAMAMAFDVGARKAAEEALGHAMPDARPDGEAGAPPGEPGGRSGGSRTSSASGSKPAGKKKPSGKRRRG